jgi:hypothetical protein
MRSNHLKLDSRKVTKGQNWKKARAPLNDNSSEVGQLSLNRKVGSTRLPTLECFCKCRSIFWRQRRNAKIKIRNNQTPNVQNI